jgi:hypothetical protein
MNDALTYGWVSLGVLVAVIFPVLSGFIRKEFPVTAAVGLPPWVKKYATLFIFSLVAAFGAAHSFKRSGCYAAYDRG